MTPPPNSPGGGRGDRRARRDGPGGAGALSLNAPVPNRLLRVAADLEPALAAFESVRTDHTLVVKRLAGRSVGTGGADPGPGAGGDTRADAGGGPDGVGALTTRLRRHLRGIGPAAARVAGLGVFEAPPSGPGPVLYLAVESPGLRAVHRRLCGPFDAVEGIEGDGYVPHVTLARGGDPADARRVADRSLDPVEWTVDELQVYDADYGRVAATLSLPV